jgi:hypothetical protein
MKNPKPVAFVQQANIAHGPQQVNNGLNKDETSRARESEISRANYWSSNAMNGWTEERRRRQGAAIRRWKPWERSTGPRSAAGKARVARNTYSGATRTLLRELARALRQQRESL